MDRRIADRYNEVVHYQEMVAEHLKLGQPHEAAGWCEALIDEAKQLKLTIERTIKVKA